MDISKKEMKLIIKALDFMLTYSPIITEFSSDKVKYTFPIRVRNLLDRLKEYTRGELDN